MTHEMRDWLVNEIRDDLFDVGKVGLYEFIWTLNGTHPDLRREQKLSIAKQALDELRFEDHVELVQLVWPSLQVVAHSDWAELNDHSWDDIADGPYYAIVSPDGAGEEPARNDHG